MKVGQQVTVIKRDGSTKNFRVTKMSGFLGLKRIEIQEAFAGDFIAISGMEDIDVGETICPIDHPEALPAIHIDEPTLQMTFLVNNSPFAGKEGKWVTARKIEERLEQQLQTDVRCVLNQQIRLMHGLFQDVESFIYPFLIENMRREGFELTSFETRSYCQRQSMVYVQSLLNVYKLIFLKNIQGQSSNRLVIVKVKCRI